MSILITFNTDVEVGLTIEQLANIIISLSSEEQARLLSLIAEANFSLPYQLSYVTDEQSLSANGRHLMRLIGTYADPLPLPSPTNPAP